MASSYKQFEKLDRVIEAAKPVVKKAGEIVDMIGPHAVTAYEKFLLLWGEAKNFNSEIKIALGFFFLFFGGNFVFTLVAVEAFMVIGFERTKRSVINLYESFKTARDVLSKDDPLDSSQSSIPAPEMPTTPVKPTTPSAPSSPSRTIADAAAFFQKTDKITQVLSKIAKTLDPEKVTQSLADLSTGVIAVIGSLQSSLARCITIGASLSDLALKHHKANFIKFASHALPQEFHKWVEPGFYYGSKVLGFIIALFIQRWLLVYSACLRGVDLLLSGLHEKKIITDEQFEIFSKISTAVASVGFMKQLFYGSNMWTIFHILLFPLFLLEFVLKLVAVFA